MMMTSSQSLLLVMLAAVLSIVRAAPGDFKTTWPPWGEPTAVTAGSQVIWFPFIGPFTRHSCFPSRYMSGRIAVSHVNRRDATYCPAIANLKNKFEFQYNVADSNGNPIEASRAVLGFLNNAPKLDQGTQGVGKTVDVVVGPNNSGSSMGMSNILAVFGIAHISWSATSAKLSNKADYPMFFRVVSPDSLAMKVLCGWVVHIGIKFANVLYFDAGFQSGQANDFINAATLIYADDIEVLPSKVPSSGEGGASINAENLPKVQATLAAIRDSGKRLIAALTIAEEAYEVWKLASDMSMVKAEGWIWCGGDGISGSQFGGDITRVPVFRGTFYIQSNSQGPDFAAYAAKWGELMPTTERPEFDVFKNCVNKTTNQARICRGHPEFKGWDDAVHTSLKCTGYTGLSYDAIVTLAYVADKLISAKIAAGTDPTKFTSKEWYDGLLALSDPGVTFDCLTGKLSFNKNQERDMPMNGFNYQDGLVAPTVLKWNGIDGYVWEKGAKVVWNSGKEATVSATGVIDFIPTGLPPVCADGAIYNNTLLKCKLCDAGSQFEEKQCRFCQAGKMQAEKGKLSCDSCPKGKFSDKGATSCIACAKGYFADSVGMPKCGECALGTFAGETSMSSCSRCKAGVYADKKAMSQCTKCPGEFTTQFLGSQAEEDCVCPRGTFLEPGGKCLTCPEGLSCKVGSTQAGFASTDVDIRATMPTVDYGYYTEVVDPLFVYQCEPKNVCPGGPPGTCAGIRVGLLCMKCPKDFIVKGIEMETPTAADYAVPEMACTPCGTNTIIYVIICLVLGTLMILYELREAKHSPLEDSPLLVEMKTVMGQVVMFIQILGAIQSADVVFGITFTDFVANLTQPLEMDFIFEGLPCMSDGFDDAVQIFAMQLLGPIFFVVILMTCFTIVNCIKPKYLMFDGLLNCFGEVLIEFYVSITIAVLGPFNCYDHPVEKASMASRPETICYEGDHVNLIILSLCGFLLYTVGALAITVFSTIQHPKRMARNDIGMLVRCHFLFNRYKPSAYWFCVISVFRNCGVAFWPMVLPDKDVSLGLMIVTLMVPLILSCTAKPRRTGAMNSLDGLVSFAQVMILAIGSMTVYTDKAEVDAIQSDVIGYFLIFLICLIAVFAAFFIITKGIQWISGGKTSWFWAFDIYIDHHGGMGAIPARTMNLMFTDLCRKGKIFYDVDWWNKTRSLGVIMDAAKLSDNCVVALSNETWCIAYCTGAICSAVQKRVPLTAVRFGISATDSDWIPTVSAAPQGGDGQGAAGRKSAISRDSVLAVLAKQAPRSQLRPLGLDDREIPKAMEAVYAARSVVYAMDDILSCEGFMRTAFDFMAGCPLKPGVSRSAESRNPVLSRYFSKADAQNNGITGDWHLAAQQTALISCDVTDPGAVATSRLFYRLCQDIRKDSGKAHKGFLNKMGKMAKLVEATAKGEVANNQEPTSQYNPGLATMATADVAVNRRVSLDVKILGQQDTQILLNLGLVEDLDLNATEFAELVNSTRLMATVILITEGTLKSSQQLLRLGYNYQHNHNGMVSFPISISSVFSFPGNKVLETIANGSQLGLNGSQRKAASLAMTTGDVKLKRVVETLSSIFQARTYICNVPLMPVEDIRVSLTNVMSKIAEMIAIGVPGNACMAGDDLEDVLVTDTGTSVPMAEEVEESTV